MIETIKTLIEQTFYKFGADEGLQRNAEHIIWLRNSSYLTEAEYYALRKYNREVYGALPFDM